MDRGDLQQLSKEQLIELVLRLQRPDPPRTGIAQGIQPEERTQTPRHAQQLRGAFGPVALPPGPGEQPQMAAQVLKEHRLA